MADKKISYIVYYYMHTRALEYFDDRYILSRDELVMYLSKAFNLGKKVRQKVVKDMEGLGLIEFINADKVELNREKTIPYLNKRRKVAC